MSSLFSFSSNQYLSDTLTLVDVRSAFCNFSKERLLWCIYLINYHSSAKLNLASGRILNLDGCIWAWKKLTFLWHYAICGTCEKDGLCIDMNYRIIRASGSWIGRSQTAKHVKCKMHIYLRKICQLILLHMNAKHVALLSFDYTTLASILLFIKSIIVEYLDDNKDLGFTATWEM